MIDTPLFLGPRQMRTILAPYGLTVASFETLPGAPAAVVWSPRRRRWRRESVEAFLAVLELTS